MSTDDERGYSWPYESQNYVIKKTRYGEASYSWEDGKFVYEAGLDIELEDGRERCVGFLHADVLIRILERAGYTVTPPTPNADGRLGFDNDPVPTRASDEITADRLAIVERLREMANLPIGGAEFRYEVELVADKLESEIRKAAASKETNDDERPRGERRRI